MSNPYVNFSRYLIQVFKSFPREALCRLLIFVIMQRQYLPKRPPPPEAILMICQAVTAVWNVPPEMCSHCGIPLLHETRKFHAGGDCVSMLGNQIIPCLHMILNPDIRKALMLELNFPALEAEPVIQWLTQSNLTTILNFHVLFLTHHFLFERVSYTPYILDKTFIGNMNSKYMKTLASYFSDRNEFPSLRMYDFHNLVCLLLFSLSFSNPFSQLSSPEVG